MISKIFSLRNYVMKQIMKPNKQGIMQIPDKGKVDFGEMIIKEQLFKKGIDPKAITSEKQLDNILNAPNVAPKVMPKKSGEVINVDFDKGRWKDTDPENLAQGGRTGTGLNYLLGEDDQNVRVPFKDGTKFDPKRRTVLKGIAALATLPVIGKFFKWAKPLAKSSKVLTQVPIKDISGMPAWFKPLVNKVIKEGTEVSSHGDRIILHKTKLPNSKTDVYVEQDLTTGHVSVDIGSGKHGFADGHLGQPVKLEYRASEVIEPVINTKTKQVIHKGQKTKEEFWVEEAEFSGGHPENVKFEESTFEKFGEHGSDFSEVEEFATGLKKGKGGSGHMASGGRVPLNEGGISDSRVGMLFGGGIYKTIIKNLAKARGVNPSEYLKITNYKALPREVRNLMPKADFEKMKAGRIEMFENWVDMVKTRKEFLKNIEQGKKTSAAPIFEHLEKSFKSPVPHGVTDKDILQGEFILKNLKTKDRKVHATGGRVPLKKGKVPKGPNEWLEILDIDWDDMDPDEWVGILRSLGVKGHATGGRVPLGKGKIVKGLASLLQKKFPGTTKLGQTSRPVAETTQLKQAIAGFQEREKAAKLKIWENPDKVRAAVDDIFSTGDYKYDAQMAAEALVENNPKAFGGKLYDDIDDATRMEIYGAVLKVVQSDLGKMLQLKRLSRPTKTLEGIKKTGTINISDDAVAEEFARFMKESDPKGFKDIEQKIQISDFDPKGKKGHASGGLAGMLGE